MPAPFLDATLRHPIIAMNGEPYPNTVYLANVIDHPNISVGEFTYYNDFDPVEDYATRITPYVYAGAPEQLTIGRFCQIGHGTRFLVAANHPTDGFTTFPFAVFDHDLMGLYGDAFSRGGGDIVIGDDVWTGQGAMVLPGVTIGDGAIIGAGAVVSKDVPAWGIVAGNPARLLRRRFAGEICDMLDRLAWWHRPLEEIRALLPMLVSGDVAALRAAAEA